MPNLFKGLAHALVLAFIVAAAAIVAGCQTYGGPGDLPFALGGSYKLDTGDQIRLFIFDQETMSRNYSVDDRGNISIPLIGNIPARGRTTVELERAVAKALQRAAIVSDPQVSVEVIGYRPFFIYGEIRGAGRYIYQPNMNVEMAIATAGGITERGSDRKFRLTRVVGNQRYVADVGLDFPIQPGDTLYIYERWF